MALKDKAKDKAKEIAKKKIKKLVFKVIKSFLPFIIVIVGIVLAVCTVVDSLFTTEEDMQVAEQLANDNYEEQYAQWLHEKENSPTSIINGSGLVPKGMFTWPIPRLYKSYFCIWYENTSNYRCV